MNVRISSINAEKHFPPLPGIHFHLQGRAIRTGTSFKSPPPSYLIFPINVLVHIEGRKLSTCLGWHLDATLYRYSGKTSVRSSATRCFGILRKRDGVRLPEGSAKQPKGQQKACLTSTEDRSICLPPPFLEIKAEYCVFVFLAVSLYRMCLCVCFVQASLGHRLHNLLRALLFYDKKEKVLRNGDRQLLPAS